MKLPPPLAALALSLSLLAGCGDPAPAAQGFVHYPALAQGLAAAEQAVADATPPAMGRPEPEPEHVTGLVYMLANSRGRTRELPLEEIGTLGDGATSILASIAANTEHDGNERMAAVELLARLATPLATEHLLQLAEKSPESWMRAQAIWRLEGIEPADWVIPRLLRRFKYEKDEETAIWLASTLAAHGNYSGLEALWRLQGEGATEEIRSRAAERIQTLATEAGAESVEALWQLWYAADPERLLHRGTPSPRLSRELWREIEQLSGEHFQLRGVDESRFILSRLGAWATEPLCSALHDTDLYVRIHSAQCLERMGPRAVNGGPALVDALTDSSLAINAAAALGKVGYPAAEPVLRRLAAGVGTSHELRVACTASLGAIGLSASLITLEELLASDTPPDLRQAAAHALVVMGAGDSGVVYLFGALSDPAADQPGAELSLGLWLAGREDEASKALLENWRALDPPPGIIFSEQEAAEVREQRRELLTELPIFGG